MKWWRITLKKPNQDLTFYGMGRDADEAIASRELFGTGFPITAMECAADEVPYKTRAFQEATTEELRYALVKRGWKVVLR